MAIHSRASLNVVDRRVLARSTDAVTYAADGVDERISLLTVDLAAHAPDVDVDDVGGGIEVQVPDMLQQHRARNHLVLIAHQVLENLKLARKQLDRPSGTARRPRHEIEFEVAHAQHGFLDHGLAAPRERFDTGHQFHKGKRLDQIVVAAGPQPANPIVDLAERADDQRGRDDALFPELPNDRYPIHVRKHAV